MNQETNIKFVKIGILSIPIFTMWVSDFLISIPLSMFISILISNFSEGIGWFPIIGYISIPLKVAISAIAVYYAIKQWQKYFPQNNNNL